MWVRSWWSVLSHPSELSVTHSEVCKRSPKSPALLSLVLHVSSRALTPSVPLGVKPLLPPLPKTAETPNLKMYFYSENNSAETESQDTFLSCITQTQTPVNQLTVCFEATGTLVQQSDINIGKQAPRSNQGASLIKNAICVQDDSFNHTHSTRHSTDLLKDKRKTCLQ